jgi:hypothetical protein
MRVSFLFVVATCFFPFLLALVVHVPHNERPEYGALLARETNTTEATDSSHDDTKPTNATSAATSGNLTSASASPSTVPLLNTSTDEIEDGKQLYTLLLPIIPRLMIHTEEGRQNAILPGTLPIQPKVTPALGVGGFILLITGAVLALIGVRNLW